MITIYIAYPTMISILYLAFNIFFSSPHKHYATYVQKYPAHINTKKGRQKFISKEINVSACVGEWNTEASLCLVKILSHLRPLLIALSFLSVSFFCFLNFRGREGKFFSFIEEKKKLIRFPLPSSFEREAYLAIM